MVLPTTEALSQPAVPLTIEGSSVLHQMFSVDWTAWRKLPADEKTDIVDQAAGALTRMESGGAQASALYELLGHKGDLMLVHFRQSFDELVEAQSEVRKLALFDFIRPTTSYLSMVELGLYESTQKAYGSLAEQGIQSHTPEWNAAIEDTLQRQREAMRSRLFPEIPPAKYLCFYPMDRRRGEDKNWYEVSMAERSRMMHEHGLVGRRYAGTVRQIITGSIGFDDWEWGVDLFADDPLVFKRLIYEMRFDEVSAVYALFGSFYVGKRCSGPEFEKFFDLS
ncbi:MAG TPA: hydrogen peroxide-dependent heme synthase [Bryobacteraceae bacterium]|nr:hydrogen peroxide-dependent heme synthase [Bryobacteraceae bacterium]